VLGDLRRGGRVDGAHDGADDDVGDGGVLGWVAKAFVDQALAVDEVVDFQGGALGVQVGNCGVGVAGFFEEDKADVIGCDE